MFAEENLNQPTPYQPGGSGNQNGTVLPETRIQTQTFHGASPFCHISFKIEYSL